MVINRAIILNNLSMLIDFSIGIYTTTSLLNSAESTNVQDPTLKVSAYIT